MLGPRVGGAHVEVNMDFDDRSLDRIGQRIHQRLQQLGGDADRTFGRQFREAIGEAQVVLGGIVTTLPLITSAVSTLGGAITALGSALANASVSLLSLVGVAGSVGIALGTAALGFEGFGDAVNAENAEDLAAALENLSPTAQAAALAVRSLKDDWKRLRLQVQNRMFAGLAEDIRKLGDTLLPVLSDGLNSMANSLNSLFESVLDYVNSSDGLEVINNILRRSAGIFDTLQAAAVPFLDGLLRLWDALLPSAGRLAEKIADIATRFQEWANEAGMAERIDTMMQSAEATASKLWTVIKNLGGAIRDIFGAAQPAGDTFLDWLIEITDKFREWTSSTEGQDSIAQWAEDGVETIKKLGEVLGQVGEFFVKVSDPAVIQGVLDVLEEMFDTLNNLPIEDVVSGLGDLLSENSPLLGGILAVGAALSGLRVIGGTVNAVFGGLATTVLNFGGIFTGFKSLFGEGGLLGPLAAQGAHGVAVGRVTQVLGSLTTGLRTLGSLLPTLLKGAGIAGLVVWIGTTIAGSEELRDKLGQIFEKLGEVFGKLGEAIGKVAKSLEPVFKLFVNLMKFLTPILEFLLSVTFDAILIGLDALGTVIEGVGNVLSGFIDIFIGIFTLDFDKVLAGFVSLFTGIGQVIMGALQSVTAFPAAIGRVAIDAAQSFATAVVAAAPRVLEAVGNFIARVLIFVQQLPGRFREFATNAMSTLATALTLAIPVVIEVVQGFISDVIDFVADLPGEFDELARNAMTNLKDALTNGVSAVTGAISSLPGDIMDLLDDLPGQMLDLGGELISELASGITSAIPDVLGSALDGIGSAIGGVLPGSPVRTGPLTAWNYGSGASGGGRNVIAALAEGLRDTSPISAAMNDIARAISSPMSGGTVNHTSNLTLQVVQYPGEDQISAGMRALNHSRRVQEEVGTL